MYDYSSMLFILIINMWFKDFFWIKPITVVYSIIIDIFPLNSVLRHIFIKYKNIISNLKKDGWGGIWTHYNWNLRLWIGYLTHLSMNYNEPYHHAL